MLPDVNKRPMGAAIVAARNHAEALGAGPHASHVTAQAVQATFGSRTPLAVTSLQMTRLRAEVARFTKRASARAREDRRIGFTAAQISGLVTKGAAATPFSVDVPILKSEQEEQFIYGVVLEPTKEMIKPDCQDDIYSAEEVRRACHKFMADYRRRDGTGVVDMGIQHSQSAGERIKVLENFIAPCDLTIDGKHVAKGTWLLGAWVDSDIWGKVKKGEITGFSIGGRARRTRVQG